MTRNTPAWIGIAVLLAAGGYLVAGQGILDTGPQPPLSSGIALLIVIAGSTLFGYREDTNQALKQTLVWLALGLMLVIVYVYRTEFNQMGGRLLAELLPAGSYAGMPADDRAVEGISAAPTEVAETAISASRGGHFFVEAMINGSHVRLIADTGATLVSLTAADARRLGFDPDELDFAFAHRTANGIARAAHISLDEVRVGPIRLENVEASIAEDGRLEENLLGMSFLSRLSSFQIRGDQLVLEQ
jgi:aspartyl protease family protein